MTQKRVTIGVFIDLKKAFDTINHKILLNKLEMYGIRGMALEWLQNYLSERLQYVNYQGVNSEKSKMLCGVPQGSILGPTLFLLYINYICNVSRVLSLTLFADDTTVLVSGNDVEKLKNVLCVELDKLNVWFRANKLSLNVTKTNFMIFANKSIVNFDIKIDGMLIERVYLTKVL